MPRIAAPIRAGDEFLGSIWVAAPGDLSANREAGLRDAAKLAALHLLRVRAGADVQRRMHTDLLSTALEGGPVAHSALARLGLADQRLMIMGIALRRPRQDSVGADVMAMGDGARLADALAMHVSAVHAGATAALVGDVAYGLIPVTPNLGSAAGRGTVIDHDNNDDERRALHIAGDFLERVGRRYPAVIGVGPTSSNVAALAQARATVDRVLRVLRSGGTRVARLADVHTEALMLELQDLASARGDRPTGSVARLIAYDLKNGTELVLTLRAWLDSFGDVTSAAGQLFVHPNTFRYRLRRLAEVGDLDLSDPEQRFTAMVQLRVLVPRTASDSV
jgi:DNA-binding PucR family transcriptional regulator